MPILLDYTDIGSVLHNKSTLCSNLCDGTAFLLVLRTI